MQIEEELARSQPEKDTLLTIGVFDGVHLGHKYLLSQLTKQARERNLLSGVVTFNQHPQEVLSPQTRLPFLTNLAQRTELIKNEGVEAVITLSFTAELAQLSARQFATLLQKYLRMRGLVLGPDFALGRGREGNTIALSALGEDMGFTVTTISPVTINGEVASSTAVRNALANGDIKRVLKLTGRPFSLSGPVAKGTGRGTGLGFPTTNIATDPGQALPADGVYATWSHIEGKLYKSMTNIGKNPTFGSSQRTIEVYILDYHGDLYGHNLTIDLVERLRGEKQFGTTEELKKQIAEDIKQGKKILASQARG